MTAQKTFQYHRWDELPEEVLKGGIRRRIITGDGMMIGHVMLKKGDDVPRHFHHNEQISYIISGALRFTLGERGEHEVVVRSGEVLIIPSNLPHSAYALEDTLDIDVFNPPREDWLNKTDSYLRDEKTK